MGCSMVALKSLNHKLTHANFMFNGIAKVALRSQCQNYGIFRIDQCYNLTVQNTILIDAKNGVGFLCNKSEHGIINILCQTMLKMV